MLKVVVWQPYYSGAIILNQFRKGSYRDEFTGAVSFNGWRYFAYWLINFSYWAADTVTQGDVTIVIWCSDWQQWVKYDPAVVSRLR